MLMGSLLASKDAQSAGISAGSVSGVMGGRLSLDLSAAVAEMLMSTPSVQSLSDCIMVSVSGASFVVLNALGNEQIF